MVRKQERKSRAVRLWLAFALTALIAGVAPVFANGTDGPVQAKIDAKVLEDLAAKGSAPFVIYLKDQADVSAAYGMHDQDARGWYVYRTLKAHAARAQGPIRDALEARGVSYRAFWVANVIMAQGDTALIDHLAARSDVARIESDAKSNWLQGTEQLPSVDAPGTVEWGVDRVKAP